MNEAILLSVLGSDETKSLRIVEPLHFSGGTHFGTSSAIGRKCRVAVPVRLLFVRDPDDRMSRQKIKRPGNTPGPCTAIWHLSRKRCASVKKDNGLRSCGQSICAGFDSLFSRDSVGLDHFSVRLEHAARS